MLSKLILYLSLLTLIGCSGAGREGSHDSLPASSSVDSLNKKVTAHPASNSEDSVVNDPDTVFSLYALRLINGFPECKLAQKYIDSVTHGSRGLIISVSDIPSKDAPYYEIDAGDRIPQDSIDSHFDVYLHFHVYNNNGKPSIRYYDIPDDKEWSLEEWRKKENESKKKGHKYYFFYIDDTE